MQKGVLKKYIYFYWEDSGLSEKILKNLFIPSDGWTLYFFFLYVYCINIYTDTHKARIKMFR